MQLYVGLAMEADVVSANPANAEAKGVSTIVQRHRGRPVDAALDSPAAPWHGTRLEFLSDEPAMPTRLATTLPPRARANPSHARPLRDRRTSDVRPRACEPMASPPCISRSATRAIFARPNPSAGPPSPHAWPRHGRTRRLGAPGRRGAPARSRVHARSAAAHARTRARRPCHPRHGAGFLPSAAPCATVRDPARRPLSSRRRHRPCGPWHHGAPVTGSPART